MARYFSWFWKFFPDFRSEIFQGLQYWIHNSLFTLTNIWLKVKSLEPFIYLLALQQFSSCMTRVTLMKSSRMSSSMFLIKWIMSLVFISYYQYWLALIFMWMLLFRDLSLLTTRVTLIQSFWRMFLTQMRMSVSEFELLFWIFIFYLHPF